MTAKKEPAADAVPEGATRFYDEAGGHVDVYSQLEVTQYRYTRGYTETPPEQPAEQSGPDVAVPPGPAPSDAPPA